MLSLCVAIFFWGGCHAVTLRSMSSMDEFTENNEEFMATCVLPPYLPVRMLRDTFLFTLRE
jgi:hypothetical protein